MFVTRDSSSRLDPDQIIEPEKRGGVAWGQFNESFEQLQRTPWHAVNRGTDYPLLTRLLRLVMAYAAQRNQSIVDVAGKARALFAMNVPRDPDVVFFGAEAGWEAFIIQALFGDGGRCVLIDNDPAAYQRFLNAPTEMVARAPRGYPGRELMVRRQLDRVEYVQADFFDAPFERAFDVGIDWGIIEHYDDDRKLAVMKNFQRYIKDGGLEISSCPRDTLAVRLFYRAFREEMNFGYRELMTLGEHRAQLERAGFVPETEIRLQAHNVIGARVHH